MSRSLVTSAEWRISPVVLAPLLGVGLFAAGAPSAAQTEADILVSSVNPVGAFIEEAWAGTPSVTVTTGTAEDEVLRATVSVGGVTVYHDGELGMVNAGFGAGELDQDLGRALGGSVESRISGFTAQVTSLTQASGTAYSTNGGVATVSAHTSVHNIAISTSSGGD